MDYDPKKTIDTSREGLEREFLGVHYAISQLSGFLLEQDHHMGFLETRIKTLEDFITRHLN